MQEESQRFVTHIDYFLNIIFYVYCIFKNICECLYTIIPGRITLIILKFETSEINLQIKNLRFYHDFFY